MLEYQWQLPLGARIVRDVFPFYSPFIVYHVKYFDPEKYFSLVHGQTLPFMDSAFVKYAFQTTTQNSEQYEEKYYQMWLHKNEKLV